MVIEFFHCIGLKMQGLFGKVPEKLFQNNFGKYFMKTALNCFEEHNSFQELKKRHQFSLLNLHEVVCYIIRTVFKVFLNSQMFIKHSEKALQICYFFKRRKKEYFQNEVQKLYSEIPFRCVLMLENGFLSEESKTVFRSVSKHTFSFIIIQVLVQIYMYICIHVWVCLYISWLCLHFYNLHFQHFDILPFFFVSV